MNDLVGCCDLGGTTLRVAVADRDGKLVQRKTQPHAQRDPDTIVELMACELKAMARAEGAALAGVGVSAPGPLDPVTGLIHFSPNLGWREVPLTDQLRERLDVPVVLDDDANCGALGEHWRGHHTARHFLYVVVGTGIGAGLILDGKLYHGARGGAGELGHMTIIPDGPRCSCGNRGCVEALAAGPAIARRAEALLGIRGLSAQNVISRARAGDPIASEVLAEVGCYLGIALASVVNLLNPELIVVGGGVGLDAGELLLEPARSEMARRAFASSVAAVSVRRGALGDDAGLIGAARLIWTFIRGANNEHK